MPPTAVQPEVIEIPDSPTAPPEIMVISDDEATELLDYRAKQVNLLPIPLMQPVFKPEREDSPKSMVPALVDIKSSDDHPMGSPGLGISFQSPSSGYRHPTREDSCLDVLDRELVEISQEIEKDSSSLITQSLQDFESIPQPRFTDTANEVGFVQGLEQGEASTPSRGIVYHAIKKTRVPNSHGNSVETLERAVPKFNHYIEIERSFQANRTRLPPQSSDQEKDTSKEDRDDVIKPMLLCAKFAKQSRRSENFARIGAYLPQIRSAHQECRDRLDEEGLYESLNHTDPKHPSYHVEKAFGIPLGPFLGSETPASNPQKIIAASPDPLEKTLERYSQASCLICSAHHCQIHGKLDDDSSEDDSDSTDTTDKESPSNKSGTAYQLYNMPHTRMRTYNRRVNPIENESEDDSNSGEENGRYNCSAACRLNPSNVELNSEGTWTSEDYALMQVLDFYTRIRKNRRASCLISDMMRKPCSEVHHHLKKLSSQRIGLDDVATGNEKRQKKFSWRDFEGEYKHDKRLQPKPCYHPGQNCFAAGKKCTCVSNEIFCDKFCTCPQNCYARYPGCDCTERCLPKSCTCNDLNRECDPDLCHGCRVADVVRSQGPVSDKDCRNCEIQRAQGKKILVGESSIEGIGNGLYMAEPVQEGDFIAEYVGEIIGESELGRREAIKRRMGMSYNFTLNAETTIDAMWYGNATRFINHSKARKNCRAKVLLVNCEHRICFFATKNINAGEELFFDYGKDYKLAEEKEGDISPSARKKSASKKQRKVPSESTVTNPKAGVGPGGNEEEGQGDPFQDDGFMDWHATQKSRASDDDEEYIERGSQQGSQRARPSLRSKRGRR